MDFAVFDSTRAFTWGFLSALSLPFGAAIGLQFSPSQKWTSSLMAFGGGALLAALTLELVAESLHRAGFGVLAAGFLTGSLLFILLNELLNKNGGFLRKDSTTLTYLTEKKRVQAENVLDKLASVEILRALPPEEIESVLPLVRPVRHAAGEYIFRQGDPGDRLFLIEEGQVQILHTEKGEKPQAMAELRAGDVFGEVALLTGEPRIATARAANDVKLWTIAKEDFERLMQESPKLRREVQALIKRRHAEQAAKAPHADLGASAWAKAAKASVFIGDLTPTSEDILRAQGEAGGGAPLAIWLGILLDGIPESLVIGASMLGGKSVSPALFVGVLLANFPEALSSAVGMHRQGMSQTRVMWMWGSLAVMTGLGAGIGNLTFGNVSPTLLALMEAGAAGSMLTMIAETMLPEAVEQGGPATGLMTVLGFLAALAATTLNHP